MNSSRLHHVEDQAPSMRSEGLHLAYDDRIVVDNLDLAIPKGRITVIVGANACGKSTLLRGLARLLKPAGGTVLLDGADVDDQITNVANALDGLKGKTVAIAYYVAGDGITVVADPDDGAFELFDELGMKLDPQIVAAADGQTGRTKLSFENVAMLDADLMIIAGFQGADPSTMPGYASLPSVRNGTAVTLSSADISAINTPSPLSVPYILAKLRPTLAKVAGD